MSHKHTYQGTDGETRDSTVPDVAEEDVINNDFEPPSPEVVAMLRARDAVKQDFGMMHIDRVMLDRVLYKADYIPWNRLTRAMAASLHFDDAMEASQSENWRRFVRLVCEHAGDSITPANRVRLEEQNPEPVPGFAHAAMEALGLDHSDLMIAHMMQSEQGREAEIDDKTSIRLEEAEDAVYVERGQASERRQFIRDHVSPLDTMGGKSGSPYDRWQEMLNAARAAHPDKGPHKGG